MGIVTVRISAVQEQQKSIAAYNEKFTMMESQLPARGI